MRKSTEADFPTREEIHIDLEAINHAIDLFAKEMKKTMEIKAKEGRRGWNDPQYQQPIYEDLLAHAIVAGNDPRQYVHVGNFAMMLFAQKRQQAGGAE